MSHRSHSSELEVENHKSSSNAKLVKKDCNVLPAKRGCSAPPAGRHRRGYNTKNLKRSFSAPSATNLPSDNGISLHSKTIISPSPKQPNMSLIQLRRENVFLNLRLKYRPQLDQRGTHYINLPRLSRTCPRLPTHPHRPSLHLHLPSLSSLLQVRRLSHSLKARMHEKSPHLTSPFPRPSTRCKTRLPRPPPRRHEVFLLGATLAFERTWKTILRSGIY